MQISWQEAYLTHALHGVIRELTQRFTRRAFR
ncbi:hypothetical protein CSING_01960 [Corynebacterium singulare]|uniref:Uncharacterized protein n=1 Tax=Corynebacterium singulare TaxID=161899 RepID=A0A0B6F0G3_9CORY|nr:hypothetical protein CSING_01960 [Corynebacterium singulare]